MGVVMMTGIMTVVEMGLSLTGQSLLSKPEDPYQQNRLAGKRDQDMLRLLHNPDDLEDYLDKVEGQIQTKIDLISDAFKENIGYLEIKKDVRELKFYEQLLNESSKLMDEWL